MKAAAAAAASGKKEPLPVEKKLEMSLGDIEKAQPRRRKVFLCFLSFFVSFFFLFLFLF